MIYFPLAFAKNLGVDFDLSTYARQPAGGAYVGPSCATLAYVGLMLTHVEPKDPKNANSKKHCKTQESFDGRRPILGLCWPILRAMWAHLGAMLAHLGAMLAHLEAMLVHLEGNVGPS